MSRAIAAWAAAVLWLAAGCRNAPVESSPCPEPALFGPMSRAAPLDSVPSPFDAAFATAGTEFAVPPALLKAIGWVETRWQMVEGAEEFPGLAPGFGVMALRGAALTRGAALAGVTPETAHRDPVANIRAAAALLDAYATEMGIDRSRSAEWAAVVARLSEIELAAGRTAYVREVDRALRRAGPTGAVVAPSGPCPEPPPPPPP
ncbi:MAG: N-acetylmuramoyl-L-alanine amidase, partial [Gemmatimonadales bacterium]